MISLGDHLGELLESHHPADTVEAGHLRRMQALIRLSRDVFRRDHFEPGHFTASAFVLSPDGGSLLLVFHGKLSRWLQPGGHVEPHDVSVIDAALREVREETGVQADRSDVRLLDVDVHAIPSLGTSPAHEHFDVRFLMRAETTRARAASDARAVRWTPLDEVSSRESDESVLRAVRKIQRGSARVTLRSRGSHTGSGS